MRIRVLRHCLHSSLVHYLLSSSLRTRSTVSTLAVYTTIDIISLTLWDMYIAAHLSKRAWRLSHAHWFVAWCCGEFSWFIGVALAWPLCGIDGMDLELGHVVEHDGVALGGLAEMPAMTVSALLGSVDGVLVPGPSF